MTRVHARNLIISITRMLAKRMIRIQSGALPYKNIGLRNTYLKSSFGPVHHMSVCVCGRARARAYLCENAVGMYAYII